MWRGPVFLTLGFLSHLALCGSAWWSPSPGLCSIQSFSQTSVLPFLTLTHALTVYDTPPVVSALASNPNGEFVTVLCLCSHHCLTVSGSTGQWCPLMRNCAGGGFLLHLLIRVPPCLALALATLWLFHRTIAPMDDVRCGLRLFLSSCRNPSDHWEPLRVASLIFPECAHYWIAWHSVHVACHSLIHHHLSLQFGVLATCQYRSTMPCLPCRFL